MILLPKNNSDISRFFVVVTSTANVTFHFLSLFLANRMMLTITKQCQPQPQAAVINTSGKRGKSNECCMLFQHFN